MGLECRETLNAVRFAADALEFEETDDDFQLQQKLPQSAQSNMSALPKIQNAIPAPLEPPELSQIVPSKRNREGEIIQRLPCSQIPDVDKKQLLMAMMKHDRDFKQMFFDAFSKL